MNLYLNASQDTFPITVVGFGDTLRFKEGLDMTLGTEHHPITLTAANIHVVEIKDFISNFEIRQAQIHKLSLKDIVIFRSLSLVNTKLDSIDLENTRVPRIKLVDLDLSKFSGFFDLRHIRSDSVLELTLANVDLDKLIIPFDRVRLRIEKKGQRYERTAILYQQLLNQLKEKGLTELYEQYDKEFLQFKYLAHHHWFINFISKTWWDYGYDKGRVFEIACVMFLLFFMINLLCISALRSTYWPEKFKDHHDQIREEFAERPRSFRYYYRHTFSIFLYTAFLFWGLRLEVKEMALQRNAAIFLILLQYLLGVICIAYLANYVLSR